MFKLTPDPTFPFTATITMPGGQTTRDLALVGKAMSRKALVAWMASAGALDASGKARSDVDFLMDAIADWGPDGVAGEDGQPVPFNRDTFDQLLDTYPMAGTDIYRDYLKALTQARAGN